MKRFKLILLSTLLFLAFVTCKKKAVKVDHNFVGEWKQYGVYVMSEITIPEKGKAKHHSIVGTDENTVEGVAKIDKKKNELFIEFHHWKIIDYPYQDNDPLLGGAVWKMKLDDVGYYRPQ